MNGLKLRSPAKINLYLEITGKRPDGYHFLETIFQEMSLYDELHIEKKSSPGIEITSNSKDIPCDARNLVFRASEAFFKAAQVQAGVSIHIEKSIPVAGGMGGGSSNAASALMGLEKLFGIELEKSSRHSIARSLGADVPFFLHGGTALGRGIGDELEEISCQKSFHVLLVNPNFKIATADVYRGLKLDLTGVQSGISLMRSALEKGDVNLLAQRLFNRLEDVVFLKFPEIKKIKDSLIRWGALGALLSGSGSTLFALTDSPEKAEKLRDQVNANFDFWTHVCETVPQRVSC
jgi:4-diphosphocytidyl-2-C-methyl-D-erythritol kinase